MQLCGVGVSLAPFTSCQRQPTDKLGSLVAGHLRCQEYVEHRCLLPDNVPCKGGCVIPASSYMHPIQKYRFPRDLPALTTSRFGNRPILIQNSTGGFLSPSSAGVPDPSSFQAHAIEQNQGIRPLFSLKCVRSSLTSLAICKGCLQGLLVYLPSTDSLRRSARDTLH